MCKAARAGRRRAVWKTMERPFKIPPGLNYPADLPIIARKVEIVKAIRANRVVIVSGETGSGKTTQIPKMCLEAGRGRNGLIGCTEPRRIAAVTVARRIAAELGEEIGRTVGYKIRFEERTGKTAAIKVMTDGVLLMEAQRDRLLAAYDTIIVDEAHERSANIDFLLGILRTILARRRDLKIVITSATIDTDKFARAFGNAPVIEVSGRMFPVEVRYQPVDPGREGEGGAGYVEGAVEAVETLRRDYHGGDILVFMPTEQDIRETCEILAGRFGTEAAVLPMFARMTWTDQQRVFTPQPVRKIIVATNVAETSITIPGIRYVVDTGLARLLEYNPRSRTTSLAVQEISQSSAEQRKGRCGRVRAGVCVRLYSEENYRERPRFTPPEILRTNLAEVILRMVSLKLGNIHDFPFIDPPAPKAIRNGIEILEELGAIHPEKEVGRAGAAGFVLTERGRLMSHLPVDPRLSRMIIEARQEGCLDDIKIIAAALSTQDPRERPAEKETQADRMHETFRDAASDFMTMLNIWRRYDKLVKTGTTASQLRKFCRDHFLSFRRMREWRDVHEQISDILKEQRVREKADAAKASGTKETYDRIHRSILSGYLSNIAQKKEKNFYLAAKGREAMIFPGSAIFGKGAPWIVAAEMVETSRLFARMAAAIDVDWMERLGGDLCRSTYSEPHWEENRGEVVAWEQVTLFGLTIVPRRRASYGPIDPAEASQIFVRSALIEGNIKKAFPFLAHNRKLIAEVEEMEEKIRRRDILTGEDMLAAFYESRLPGIYDIRTLQKLILDRGGDTFLRMTREDVLRNEPDPRELSLYPDEVKLGRFSFRASYRFDPGSPDDGLTIKIPVNMISQVPAAAVDRLVPGLLREKIAALIRGLPKAYRRHLQPIARTCEILMEGMDETDAPIVSVLGRMIRERFGLDIPASAWPTEALDKHLKMRLAVVDGKDREIAASRDIHALQAEALSAGESRAFAAMQARWEKTGLVDWTCEDLPETIPLQYHGHSEGYAFPSLTAEGDGAAVRLYRSEREARVAHLAGVRALFAVRFADEMRHLKKSIGLSGEMKHWAADVMGVKPFEQAVMEKVMHDLFDVNIRTAEAFRRHGAEVRPRILPAGQEAIRTAGPILKAAFDTISSIKVLEQANRGSKPVLKFLADLKKEAGNLVPPSFLLSYDTERFSHIVRYLKALTIRATRGAVHLEKDLAKAGELSPFAVWHDEQTAALPPAATEEKRQALAAFRWMLEEYKISLFAQELKTAFPVSPKRLRQQMEEIDRIF